MTRFGHIRSSAGAAQAYELTAGEGAAGAGPARAAGADAAGAGAGAGVLHAAHPPHASAPAAPHHDPRKRKSQTYSDGYEMPSCEVPLSAPSGPMQQPASATRKRKPSSYGAGSAYDDDGSEDTRSTRTLPDKKQNHSEIEKRRRDKMNTYISELSAMIPMCGAMARKLDKLTVLRMAVQHLRSVRGALSAGPLTVRPRPAFLSERELNSLVLQAARDCFLMVVGCDRGRLLYVSASVTSMLHYEQSELLGQSLFDILHPKDVAKVKEQLSSSDLSPRERLIDAKTMLPVKADVVAGASRLCPGARRSFFCRIKCRASVDPGAGANPPDPIPAIPPSGQVKEETDTTAKHRKKQAYEKKYCVVQCTGYLKSWAPAEMSEAGSVEAGPDDGEACNLSCLVAVVRALADLAPCPAPVPQARCLQYVSRHATDGKFLFVDQRVTLALGFLPQELLGTSLYEYVNAAELGFVARTHKAALLRRDALRTPPYCFRKKDGSYARIQTHFKPFRNPWTKDVECLVANNTVVTDSRDEPPPDDCHPFDMYKQNAPPRDDLDSELSEADVEMQRLIDSQIESHKIGSTIAEEALRRSSSEFSPDLPADLLQDVVFNQQRLYDSPNEPVNIGSTGTVAEDGMRQSPSDLSQELPEEFFQESDFDQQASLVDNILGVDMGSFNNQVRNNVPLSSAGAEGSPPPVEGELPPSTPPPASPPLPPLGLDGNGEAAMAVIMSLLEADAGLGGPVNFSGLPWPLP